MGFAKYTIIGAALSLVGCIGDVESAETALLDDAALEIEGTEAALCGRPSSTEIDPRRSLAITDKPILKAFSFERVMKQLVSQARVPGLTATELFQQWWDTQNPADSAAFDGPHCDDEVDSALGPVLNGFPYSCRATPAEGAQASCDPFAEGSSCKYIPIGLFNRFDLASEEDGTCGEYRIVFAKEGGQTNGRDRNLLIFEAAVANPYPAYGLAGCRSIVNFWANLSQIDSIRERKARLEQLYFRGIGRNIPAVVDIRNFGDNPRGVGQVRTNQFMQDLDERAWSLREFKLEKHCTYTSSRGHRRGRHGRRRHAQRCELTFRPVTNKVNPYGPLFAPTDTHPERAAFQALFVDEVESLAGDTLGEISMHVDDRFNSAQSQASGSTETNYLFHYDFGGELDQKIQDRLDALGSELEPIDIIARAQAQSCAGCHRLSNGQDLGGGLTWPASLGFTHVDERSTETVDGVERFLISAALTDAFLPDREANMEDFLNGFRPRRRRHYGRYSH